MLRSDKDGDIASLNYTSLLPFVKLDEHSEHACDIFLPCCANFWAVQAHTLCAASTVCRRLRN